MIMHSPRTLRRLRRRVSLTTALVGFAALSGSDGTAQAATTPNFNNKGEANASVLFGDHDVDANTTSPSNVNVSLPTSGTIPGTPALMSPFNSTGNLISVAGGSSRAKGGAGHSEGSNLAKITFPSGAGVDQIDAFPHDVGPSVFTLSFNFKWDLPGPGTLGPPMSGTFSVPIAAKVGTGPGAFAKFEWDIKWDAVINGATVSNIRTPWAGQYTFTGAGTHTKTFTAPTSSFSPSSIATGGNDDRLIVHGAIRFIANNDDSRTVIETLGPNPDELDEEIRSDPNFQQQYNNDPSLQNTPTVGFEEPIPGPSTYWDCNGVIPGAGGATPSGNWDGAAVRFNTDSTGGAAGILSTLPSPSDTVVFAAGSDATGSYNVNVVGTQLAAAVHVDEGDVTLDGGTLAVGDYDVINGSTGTVMSTITSPTNHLTKGGAGMLRVPKLPQHHNVTINGGTVRVLHSAPLGIDPESGDNAFVSQVTSLAIVPGATLDLTNNDLIVDYSASGVSPAADLEALVAMGYNGGDWLGTGITSTTAAADANFVLGVADNALLAAPFGSVTGGPFFSGIDVPLNCVLVKFTHRVDVNLDGLITPDDAAIFGTNYDESITSGFTWRMGDMNFDGACTPDDAAIFGTFYDEALTQVPEPACVGVLVMAVLGLTRRRRPPA